MAAATNSKLMQRALQQLFDIREGEERRALLMLFYIFLVISSLLIVKPVCNALFLARFGAKQLPYVFVLVAIFAGGVSTLYSRLLKRVALNLLIIRSLKIMIGCLALFWFLISFSILESWALYAFYVWVAIFAVVTASQFWILANVTFNSREAKRLFGFIGAGAIAGGIFGGYLTNFLAPLLHSENLILVCALFLGVCIYLVDRVWQEYLKGEGIDKERAPREITRVIEHPLRLIMTNRHLAFLAGIVGMSVLVAKLAEFQFSAIALAEIPDENELAAFFGFWLSNLNIISLLIQLFLTRRVVGVFGVGTSLFFLPAGIFMGAAAILIHPALWSGVLIKIADGSLKQSINKAGMELLALPIPTEIKNQAKAFIDVFVDSFATGIGGFMLILLTLVPAFSVRHVSVIIILLLIGWAYVANKVRHEYIHSFRLKLEDHRSDEPSPPVDLKNESVFSGLIKVLEGDDEQQILQILRMVKEVQNPRLLPCFERLLRHDSSAIRAEVLKNLYYYKTTKFLDPVKTLVLDSNPEVRLEALHYLFQHPANDRVGSFQAYLEHEDYHIRGAALLCLAREGRNNLELQRIFRCRELIVSELRNLRHLHDGDQIRFVKANCAQAIGALHAPELNAYLHILLDDDSPEVVRAAVLGAGQSGSYEFVPILIRLLSNPELRAVAGQALANYGDLIIEVLRGHLDNPYEDHNIRKSIPAVVAAIAVQKSVNVLVRSLDQHDETIRHEVVRALNDLRINHPALNFNEPRIVRRVMSEAHNYVETLAAFRTQVLAEAMKQSNPESDSPRAALSESRRQLVQLLEKRLDDNLERIFKLLGLKYPFEDIQKVYTGIKSDEHDLRLNAVEFLDNVLDAGLKKLVIPIVETTLVDTLIEETLARLDVKLPSEHECLTMLLAGTDIELTLSALQVVSHFRDERYLSHVGPLVNSSDPRIRKIARQALHQFGVLDFSPSND